MAKKQEITKETATAAAPARVAKPKAPRVKAAQHSKTISSEITASEPAAAPPVNEGISENSHEVIAAIAYSYWEARGCQGGAPLEDWVRAEQEYRRGLAVAAHA
jgi:hypothetical protein